MSLEGSGDDGVPPHGHLDSAGPPIAVASQGGSSMRRMFALLVAVLLVASLAGSSVAAAPQHARVNHFVGNFDLLDAGGKVVGHVVADFQEPTDQRLAPGSLDIYWNWYDPENPPSSFPFMALDWPPVRESHAQLLGAWFYEQDLPAPFIHKFAAGTSGYLCDYTAPSNADCRPFSVEFQEYADPSNPNAAGWQFAPELYEDMLAANNVTAKRQADAMRARNYRARKKGPNQPARSKVVDLDTRRDAEGANQ
jgi:hypothetical protein